MEPAIFILIAVLCGVLLILLIKKKNIEHNEEKILEEQNKKLKNEKYELEKDIEIKENILKTTKEQIDELNKINNKIKEKKEEDLNQYLEKLKSLKLYQLNKELEEWARSSQQALNEAAKTLSVELNTEIESLYKTLEEYQQKEKVYKQEIQIINEENRKRELAQNEIDSHRIVLSPTEYDDIQYIVSIIHNVHNSDILKKLIWSEYLQKPFQQMIKNIFGANKPKNVIYCIEHLPTHKKYIGKTSQEVSKRWSEHIKTSLGFGNIAKSKIHEAMYLHWDEFYFSVLEQVSAQDNISERERFYINFFQSNVYGYNIK